MRDILNINNSYTIDERNFLIHQVSTIKLCIMFGINNFIQVKRFFLRDLSYSRIFKIAFKIDDLNNNKTGFVSYTKYSVNKLFKFAFLTSIYTYISSNMVKDSLTNNTYIYGYFSMIVMEYFYISKIHKYFYLMTLKSFDKNMTKELFDYKLMPYIAYFTFMNCIIYYNQDNINFINTIFPLTMIGISQYYYLLSNHMVYNNEKNDIYNPKVASLSFDKRYYVKFHFYNFLLPKAILIYMLSRTYCYDSKLNTWLI